MFGVGSLVLAGMLLAAAADGAGPPARPLPVAVPAPLQYPPPSWCWLDVRLFTSLRLGPVDYCRRRLRYRPGRLECFRFLDQVCATWVPGAGWVTARNVIDTQVLACPEGPEPPVCRQLDLPALP
jgi:hypothetical protein